LRWRKTKSPAPHSVRTPSAAIVLPTSGIEVIPVSRMAASNAKAQTTQYTKGVRFTWTLAFFRQRTYNDNTPTANRTPTSAPTVAFNHSGIAKARLRRSTGLESHDTKPWKLHNAMSTKKQFPKTQLEAFPRRPSRESKSRAQPRDRRAPDAATCCLSRRVGRFQTRSICRHRHSRITANARPFS
jgi:hypothetical protein